MGEAPEPENHGSRRTVEVASIFHAVPFPGATCRGSPSKVPIAWQWASKAEESLRESKARSVPSCQMRTGFPEGMRRGEVIFQTFILAL